MSEEKIKWTPGRITLEVVSAASLLVVIGGGVYWGYEKVFGEKPKSSKVADKTEVHTLAGRFEAALRTACKSPEGRIVVTFNKNGSFVVCPSGHELDIKKLTIEP